MFVTFEEWQKLDIFHPDDKYTDWKTEEWYNYYRCKNFYAQLLVNGSILEIGVRLGYSAYSFLSSDYCHSYIGLDIQKPVDGGMEFETFDWVKEKVFSKFPDIKTGLVKMNTQTEEWPDLEFGFIHVDGLHTYEGTYNDLNKAWEHLSKLNGLMVLDDYMFLPEVRKAGKQFCKEKSIPLVFSPSKRGDLLIWKI